MTENDVEWSVHVSNIDPQTTEDEFYDFLAQVGQVDDCFLPRDEESNELLGFASVKFWGEECVDTAIKQLNACKLKERCIWISKASQKKNSVDAGSQIFVGNLSQDVNERDLYNIFSSSGVGVVVTVPKIVRDATGKSKGYASVCLDSVESCNEAIKANNGACMLGRPITVELAGKKGTGLNDYVQQNTVTGSSANPNSGPNLQMHPGTYVQQTSAIGTSTNFDPSQLIQGPNLQLHPSAYTTQQNYCMDSPDAAHSTTYANPNQNQFQQGHNLQTRPGPYIAPSTNFNPGQFQQYPNLQMHPGTYVPQTSATGTFANFDPSQFKQGPNQQLRCSAYTARQNYSTGSPDAAHPMTFANSNQNQLGRNLQACPGAYLAQQNDNPEFSDAGYPMKSNAGQQVWANWPNNAKQGPRQSFGDSSLSGMGSFDVGGYSANLDSQERLGFSKKPC